MSTRLIVLVLVTDEETEVLRFQVTNLSSTGKVRRRARA